MSLILVPTFAAKENVTRAMMRTDVTIVLSRGLVSSACFLPFSYLSLSNQAKKNKKKIKENLVEI